jgi:hypothetical protein
MIILKCVLEKSKLRIKFQYFVNDQNQVYSNVYNNDYNCRFPKDIRKEGTYYKVNDRDISLSGIGIKPFYTIKKTNIVVMQPEELREILNPPKVDLSQIKIFDAGECVICLSSHSTVVFLPCAHRCVCSDCSSGIKTMGNTCPVCRTRIQQSIVSESL